MMTDDDFAAERAKLIDSAWAKLAATNFTGAVMTQDEACAVWWEMNQIIKASTHPRAAIVHHLNDRLATERAKGKRCSVCARYDDPRCVTEC